MMSVDHDSDGIAVMRVGRVALQGGCDWGEMTVGEEPCLSGEVYLLLVVLLPAHCVERSRPASPFLRCDYGFKCGVDISEWLSAEQGHGQSAVERVKVGLLEFGQGFRQCPLLAENLSGPIRVAVPESLYSLSCQLAQSPDGGTRLLDVHLALPCRRTESNGRTLGLLYGLSDYYL